MSLNSKNSSLRKPQIISNSSLITRNLNTMSTNSFKFSARNYRNLDPIKKSNNPTSSLAKSRSNERNVNTIKISTHSRTNSILPFNRILNKSKKADEINSAQPLGTYVGSKLLSSVKDLRKSLKSLIDVNNKHSEDCKKTVYQR